MQKFNEFRAKNNYGIRVDRKNSKMVQNYLKSRIVTQS